MPEQSAETRPEPLVSVGIPTFNRAEKLARAAESVLGQTHRNLELVISDNASEDATEMVCRKLCEHDSRVRYLRSPLNRGPTANFNTLFAELRGDYSMVLSDDDWLDSDYVASCLAALRSRPELVLACGLARYIRDGAVVRDGAQMRLDEDSAVRRILAYLRDVDENGVFYGLMANHVLKRAAPLRNVMGNDWLLALAVIAQGKVDTLTTTTINRELDGTSADFPKLCATLSLPPWQARIPHLVIAGQVLANIGWQAPVYRSLAPLTRIRLACAAAWTAIRWRSLVWHMTMPVFAAVSKRHGGRRLWLLYRWIARLFGGAG